MNRVVVISIVICLSVIAILGFFFNLIGLVSYLLVVIGICALITSAVIVGVLKLLKGLRIYKKRVTAKSLFVSLGIIFAGIIGLLAGYVNSPSPVPPATLSVSEQLCCMFKTDQTDRITIRWLNTHRDELRLKRVLSLYEQSLITNPQDQYYAAMIFQHGTDSTHYEIAYKLAKESAENGVTEAEWLWKAAYDRWMQSIGKPQLYGTQHTFTLF